MRRAVAGIGNPLRTDDGAGPVVVARLLETGGIGDWTPIVLENDLAGLEPLLHSFDEVAVVDAIEGVGPPGTFHLLPLGGIIQPESHPLSLHELEAAAEVALAHPQGARVTSWLFGIVPYSLAYGFGLSPGMEKALPAITAGLREALLYRSGGMELRWGSSRWSQR